MLDLARARRNMIDGQLRPSSVTSPELLAAFADMPRETFLPPALQAMAYSDEELPLGAGRALVTPLVLARLIQAARPAAADRALVIGAAVGYGAAILARLVAQVVALEASVGLVASAASALATVGAASRVTLVSGPLEAGWKATAPYDVVLVEGALEVLPEAIEQQVAEGGRLVGVFVSRESLGTARLLLKTNGGLSGRPLFDAAAPRLPGLQRRPGFEFAA